MELKHSIWFLPGLAAFVLIFTTLLLVRTGTVSLRHPREKPATLPQAGFLAASERWMNILQGERKIGTAHSRLEPAEDGYHLSEKVTMRLNTMGLVQDLVLDSRGWLKPDLTLARFAFVMQSGLYTFEARGQVEDHHLVCQIRTGDDERRLRLPLQAPPYLPSGIFPAVAASGLTPGARRVFPIFDPSTMTTEDIVVTLHDREIITLGEKPLQAWKLDLSFEGISQEVWLDEQGQVLMENGLLGIRQVRVTKEEALSGRPITASEDLTGVAAVVPDRSISDPAHLTRLTLQLEGIDPARYQLDHGRQRLEGNRLTLSREDLSDLPGRLELGTLPPEAAAQLMPSTFVQSDHPKIKDLAARLVIPDDTPLANLQRLVAWIRTNIRPRPVLSLPDALNTLDKRMGDCNEHAVLLAALARAAGYPAQVEAGLVYHQGKFLYHAWNRIYIDRWITVDALFDQIPADVSHIRFARGTAREQLDILPLLGNLQIKVVAME